MIAEGFENARLRDDAANMKRLYTERRGLITIRVTFERKDDEGRCYRKVNKKVEEREEDKRRLL